MAPTPDAKPQRRTPVSYLIGAIALIILGCVTNNLVLELLVSKKKNPFADPGAGSLLTFLQFVLIAMLTLPGVLVWRPVGGLLLPRLAPTRVPLRHYAAMTGLFFGMSFLNNWAFAFNISQPLHSEQLRPSMAPGVPPGLLTTCFFILQWSFARHRSPSPTRSATLASGSGEFRACSL